MTDRPVVVTSVDSVYAAGRLGRAPCMIHGNCNDKRTGLLRATVTS